ncbi:MAG: hypothetical protein KF758_06935 [Anaerolineales bacterium]|nr:hypothetical protein [Anaerolineales bacterium]
MNAFWNKFTSQFSKVWKGSFTETIKVLINNTFEGIGETSNVLIILVKVLWVLVLVVILSIVLLFKNFYRVIRRIFIITFQEINFYIAIFAGASRTLRQKWNDILAILIDLKDYLLSKINDEDVFTGRFQGKIPQLLLWDFPIANLLWLFWLTISLLMSAILFVSFIIIFPPVLHRAIRLYLNIN